jgi:hypothetical protein
MHFTLAARILAIAALAGAAAPAAAVRCYAIVDASNQVIYQSTTPPLDLSDEGAPAREAMRVRHQQLITMNSEQCPPIDRGRVAGKGGPATVEEIVAGMRPAVAGSGAASRTRETTTEAGGINLPRITVPRDTGGGMSVGGPVSGMSIR